VWSHGFRGPGGWYIENSLTTIGLKDPVSEMNNLLWESGSDKDKAIARDRKRRLSYISNVLVVSDPKHPENEGKVFLFKYGKKIFEKIQGAMNPEFQDEKPMNPFDFWGGANFKLKIRQVDGYANFDKSEFAAPSALLGGDDSTLEKMWKTQHSLKEFTDPKNFKSYDELKARLEQVLGGNIRATASDAVAKGGAEKAAFDDEDAAPVRKPSTPPPAKKPAPVKEAVKTDDDDTEDALSYFEKLASED
jgi:hypothetical protein